MTLQTDLIFTPLYTLAYQSLALQFIQMEKEISTTKFCEF